MQLAELKIRQSADFEWPGLEPLWAKPRIAHRSHRGFAKRSSPSHPTNHPIWRGFSLPELIIALTLLGAATAVMMPLMLAVSNQRRAADQRQLALVQAENALDLLLSTAKPDATEADLLRQWTEFEQPVSAETPTLRDLERRVSIADRPQDQARQVTVELRWKNHAGQFTTPVRLSAWQFPPLGGQP